MKRHFVSKFSIRMQKLLAKSKCCIQKKSLSKNILLKSNLLAHLTPIQNFWKVAREKHFSEKKVVPAKIKKIKKISEVFL